MSHLFDEVRGQWKLNDDTGNSVWLDISANSMHFIGNGSPSVTTDIVSVSGQAISFSGNSQYLSVHPASLSAAGFDISSHFTISMHFRANTLTRAPLLGWWDGSVNQRGFLLEFRDDQKLHFWHSFDGTTAQSLEADTTVPSLSSYHHAFIIQDGVRLRMYQDNTLVGSLSVSSGLFQPTSQYLTMGAFLQVGQYAPIDIDDCIIWSRALKASERNEVSNWITNFGTKHANPGIFAPRHELILGEHVCVLQQMKRNDLQPHFFFHFMDANYNNVDCTSAIIEANMVHVDSHTVVLSANTNITFIDTVNGDSIAEGKGHLVWPNSATGLAALHRLEFQFTPVQGGKTTFNNNGNVFIQVNSDYLNE